MDMNETRTLAAYLNEEKPERDIILTAAKYVASRSANDKSHDQIVAELAGNTSDQSAITTSIAELADSPELLEQAALAVLSVAWQDDRKRAIAVAAFREAPAELPTNQTTAIALAAILAFSLWVWKSEGGETYHHSKVVRGSDGAYRSEETVERQTFPVDPKALLHELLSPHDAADSSDGESVHLTTTQIKQAQTALVDAGYKIRIDGIEGARTDAAVENYQRDHQLRVTGKLSRGTLKRLGVVVERKE
jgi:Putative peptidoglycan binding domain